jgi:TetR/AcrR family transcriptional regulator, regulator of cefoperazone and chloramphenicol sensitivity
MVKNTPTKPRAQRADGDATRARILETAGRLFGLQGFAQTTGKAICLEAGTDLAAINYHFGSRAGLYQAVLLEGHRRLFDLADLQAIAGGLESPDDKLATLIAMLVTRLGMQDNWPIKVLARELLAPSAHLQALLQDGVMPKLAVILSILGEITGIPLGDPALFQCLISVMAPCMMLMVFGLAKPPPLPVQHLLAMPPDQLAQHLTRFALAGLGSVRDSRRG